MFGNQSDLEGQFSAKRSASANHDRYRAYNCGLHITNKSNRSQSLALTNNKSYAFLDSVDCKEDNKAYVGHSVVMKCRKNTKAKLDGWVALEAQLSHKSVRVCISFIPRESIMKISIRSSHWLVIRQI